MGKAHSPSRNKHTETSPLLSPTEDVRHSEDTPKPQSWLTHDRFIWLLMIVVLLISLGDQLSETPRTRILEAVICYRYWEKVDPSKILLDRAHVGPGAVGGVDEMLCKANDVQSELAALNGWQQTFNGFPSLILALPFGWMMDRYGRKPFVALGMTAAVLSACWIQLVAWFWQSFDIRVTWVSTFFASIGGGPTMLSTGLFVLLSDVSTEGERAGLFLRVGAFNLVANLVMPPLAAWLIRYNPWIPVMLGIGLAVVSIVLFAFTPETQGYKERNGIPGHSNIQHAAEEVSAPPPDLSTSHEPVSMDFPMLYVSKLKESMSFLTDDLRVPVLILPFLAHILLVISVQLFLQYLSKRYALSLSEATLVMTIRNAVVSLLLFIILPQTSTYIVRRFGLSGQRKDLYLMRASQVIVAVGWTLVGLSPNIPTVAISLAIASLGQGAALLLRSFLTSLLPNNHIARVYTTIAIVDTLGQMAGAPLLAGLFKRGLALGGAGVGLPFYFLGLMSAIFAGLMFSVGLRKGEDGYSPIRTDEEEQ